MKLLILSDIHGNWPALQAVLAAEPRAEGILFLGDLVNYGPQPVECMLWARTNLEPKWAVQGNHDRALAHGEDPHCSAAYRVLAAATQAFTADYLNNTDMKSFLAGLTPSQETVIDYADCRLCHATPTEPLYTYLQSDAPARQWEAEVEKAQHPNFLLLGHTHRPMQRTIAGTWIVNPGSVGQPKDGDPRAAYAFWHDGTVELRRAAYDIEAAIRAYPPQLAPEIRTRLATLLRTGGR